LRPYPPSSFDKQTVSQATHTIFLTSSPPFQKKFLKIDSMEEIIHVGALKKERKYTGKDDISNSILHCFRKDKNLNTF